MNAAFAQILAVAAGGAAGTLLRHGANLLLPKAAQHPFSLATLAVNTLGCLLAGVVIAWLEQRQVDEIWRLLLLTGVLGGLTTFSAFGVDLLHLLRAGRWGWMLATVSAHVGLGLVAIVLGWKLARLTLLPGSG